MKRYINVNGVCIDTLTAQQRGLTYMIIDEKVVIIDEAGNEYEAGTCLGESDEPIILEEKPKVIYYLVVYLVGGCIDLKPFKSKDEAKAAMKKLEYDMRVDKMKILAKDTTTRWWKDTDGYWL